MLREFIIDFRNVEELDFMVVLSMATEGIGAALYIISCLHHVKTGIMVGMALVLFGAFFLFIHLGHPFKFWRVLSRTTSAWISRGAIFTAGFFFFAGLGLWSTKMAFGGMLFQTLAFVCAFAILLYTGILFSSMASVPFWHNSMLPIIFLFHSLTTGIVFSLAILLLSQNSINTNPVQISLILALFASTLVLTLAYNKSDPKSAATQKSIQLITNGPLKKIFYIGALLFGLIIPPAVLIFFYFSFLNSTTTVAVLLILTGICRYIGDISFRYCILKAGVFEPLI